MLLQRLDNNHENPLHNALKDCLQQVVSSWSRDLSKVSREVRRYVVARKTQLHVIRHFSEKLVAWKSAIADSLRPSWEMTSEWVLRFDTTKVDIDKLHLRTSIPSAHELRLEERLQALRTKFCAFVEKIREMVCIAS